MAPNRKSDDRVDRGRGPGRGPFCPSCGAPLPAAARFCPGCGGALTGRAGGGKWSGERLAGWGALAAAVAAIGFAVATLSKPDVAPPSASAARMPNFDPLPGAAPGGPPDLSRMTPRDAADRLFDRIMIATERGNHAEALDFVPMALQAYGSLATLDRDAHYHLGLIHGVAGDGANVERAIAALRQGAPNHLLAMVLEHDAAEKSGDRTTVARVRAAFARAYDAEIAQQRPEYDAHRNIIEQFRGDIGGRASPFDARPGAGPAGDAPPILK